VSVTDSVPSTIASSMGVIATSIDDLPAGMMIGPVMVL
jgi:hypothetical protein